MQVYFLHHSAVCIKMQGSLLIFDYYMPGLGNGMAQGSISDEEIRNAQRVYVFMCLYPIAITTILTRLFLSGRSLMRI